MAWRYIKKYKGGVMKLLLSTFVAMSVVYGSAHAGDDPSKDSPLHIAARAGSVQEVKDLLSKGADPFATNEKGSMPVQSAANNKVLFILVVAMNEYSVKGKKS